ncbi:YtxH domain-containing protein [Vibrio sp. JC009]|uniref:YtxH domain-containing protein n=1 Tax=Vibrio sp. JC009 TaxID=2912314 RepID=UPI0023B161CD|nr:YtxH domain-containing protein [Vibrio sp. JC009]WED24672.1 YtxH domain-containing protein [Vibrio sp. JC009]
MSDKDNPQYQGVPPEMAGQIPPQGFYGYPPVNPMMNPYMQGMAAPQHDMAQHLAHMQAMAAQQAQMMQEQAAQYQAMMAAQAQQAMSPQAQAMQEQAAQYQAMMAAQAQQAMNAQAAAQSEMGQKGNPFENDPMLQQAQAMLDGAMGEEEAGMFKELLGSLGMSDKEFWKGALVGAAAALVLSNENVRKGIMGLVSGTGDMLKSGGSSVKETAMSTASSVKENVSAGGEIFRDTYQAGKEGFKDSVERHKAPAAEEAPEAEVDPEENKGSDI